MRRRLPGRGLHRGLFVPAEPREERFDAAACDRYHRELAAAGEPDACGLCVVTCPWERSGTVGGREGGCARE